MQTAATKVMTLGVLAVRLSDRIDWVSVTTLGSKKPPESAFGRDSARLVKRYYSARMEWNQLNSDEGVWQSTGWHYQSGKGVCVLLRVLGGSRD